MISGLNITGTVYINAPNVTISDCKITSSDYWVVIVKSGITGAVVENCEINGTGSGPQGQAGIAGQGTFLKNEIYNVENGIDVRGDHTVIQDNYIHDLNVSGDPHYDGVQISGGLSDITVRHNTVFVPGSATSAVYITNDFGSINGVVVDNNQLAGGGYTVYSDEKARNSGQITGVEFTNNKLVKGYYGYDAIANNSVVWQGNTDVASGMTVLVNNTLSSTPTSPSSPTLPATPAAPTIASFSNDSGVAGDKITSDNTLTLTGTAAVNSTVKMFDGATQIGTATANGSGAWSYTTATLPDGNHNLTAKVTDATGNTSAASAVLAVKIQ